MKENDERNLETHMAKEIEGWHIHVNKDDRIKSQGISR